MDFTALELGLRNRQLLQVKCFLRIQIETFRYFIKQDLCNSSSNEQAAALEKFFLHDWQNVVNKIVSFATIQMSGDYAAKIFSILLYRSLIYSCNQLIMTVSAIQIDNDDDDDDNSDDNVFIRSTDTTQSLRSSPISNTMASDTNTNENSLRLVKQRILLHLIKQINSMRDCLDNRIRLNNSLLPNEPLESTSLKIVRPKINDDSSDHDESLSTMLKTIEALLKTYGNAHRFQELFERSLQNNSIPLFVWAVKKFAQQSNSAYGEQLIHWDIIVERIVQYTAMKISRPDSIVDDRLISEINSYLIQTGRPVFDILYALFIQTSDAIIRQKLLHIFAICLASHPEDDDPNVRIINSNVNFKQFQCQFGQYFRMLSIMDLYIFCFRPKISPVNDEEKLEIAFEWININDDDDDDNGNIRLAKSFLLPILGELTQHSQMLNNWEEMTANNYNLIVFDPFRQHIFIEENFQSYINALSVWQYLIDNNDTKSLIKWIESDQIIQPYCDQIRPINLKMSIRMCEYLLRQSPTILLADIFVALISNPYFFNQHDFSDLMAKMLSFSDFLQIIGQTNILSSVNSCSSGNGCAILEKLLNKVIKLSQLVQHCIESRQYEFLFLLYNRYKIDFDVFFSSSSNIEESSSSSKQMLNVLNFMRDLCRSNGEVFEKSLFIHQFLVNDFSKPLKSIFSHSKSFDENVRFLLETFAAGSIDLDMILMIISFSSKYGFDEFFDALQQQEPDLVKSFVNKLATKYPLVHRASISHQESNASSSSSLNIYTFLQQAIPFVDINNVFQWQTNRCLSKPITNDSNSNHHNEMPHFSQKHLSELYGFKSNLNASFYLKNLRIIEAFLTFNKFLSSNEKSRDRHSINEKLSIKAIKKSTIIGYNNISDQSIVTTCLLFQSLIKSSLMPGKHKSSSNHRSSVLRETLDKNIFNECEKFRLHLALGRLIIEYAGDFLNLEGVQQQQNVLATLLRRSHFHSDRICSQKLLDLATVALERKYSSIRKPLTKFRRQQQQQQQQQRQPPNRSLNVKFLLLFIETSNKFMTKNENDKDQIESLIPMIESSCNLLIECFEWKPLFMFAGHYSLKRPFGHFLNKCTNEDNWLVFVIFAQLYEIPKEDLQQILSQSNFNNQCIGEHLAKAFQSSRHVNVTSLSEAESRILRSKQTPDSSRNVLYSKLFKEKSIPIGSPPPGSYISANGDLNSQKRSNVQVLFESKLQLQTASKDFLQLILDIYRNCVSFAHYHRVGPSSFSIEKSFQITLLYTSVSLSNPVLALLACSMNICDQRALPVDIKTTPSSSTSPIQSPKNGHNQQSSIKRSIDSSSAFDRIKYPSFACWLLASVSTASKQSFIDWYCQTNSLNPTTDSLIDCFIHWSPERLLRLINILTANDAQNYQKILDGFKMFDIQIPILYTLLEFLIEFLVMKDYYQTSDLLQRFQTLLAEYNEEEFIQNDSNKSMDGDDSNDDSDDYEWQLSDFFQRSWIEKCSLIMITNSLLIARQFELSILLSHYNFVRIQDSFSSEIHQYVPDIRRFYLFSQCLNKVPDYSLPIGPLLSIEANTNDESRYGEVLKNLILQLQQSGHFDAARNIINLLTIENTNEFIINEWMLKAKQAELESSNINNNNNIDISFWEDCWSQVVRIDPSMHSAFKVMERFVQQLEPDQLLIKCFVLLKCLLAIETILNDTINEIESIYPIINQTKDKQQQLQQPPDDNSTISSSNASSNNNVELIQDYFNFELSFWKSVVDCEMFIQKMDTSNDMKQIVDKNIITAWQDIWKDIVQYFTKSLLRKFILPKLTERYPHIGQNVENQRSKQQQNVQIDVNQYQSLNRVIGNLLDHFCYKKAIEVAKLFGYDHDDFEIIRTCDQIASGQLKDLSDASSSVQLKIKNQGENYSNGIGKFMKVTLIAGSNLTDDQRKIMTMIETLASFTTIGEKFCEYILLHYKIACLLRKSYDELKDTDDEYSTTPCQLLEMLLLSNQIDESITVGHDVSSYSYQSFNEFNDSSMDQNQMSSLIDNYSETIMCAKEFIRFMGRIDDRLVNEEKIVDLLAEFVYNDVQRIVDRQFKDWDDPFNAQYTLFTEIELDRIQLEFNSARFSVLNRLLREPYLLGHKLLEWVKKSKTIFENAWNGFNHSDHTIDGQQPTVIHQKTEKEIRFILAKRKYYVQIVELYIRAHESFTAQCDVGGIALVLRKIRPLITQELRPARYFHLILRLLTGIGRYSEMIYCFDLFTPQLRIALLNYLKNAEHIDELLPLVAIRFFLHREMADQHRNRAEKLLMETNFNNLHTSSSSSSSSLKTAMPIRSLTKKVSSTNSLSEMISTSPSLPTFKLTPSLLNMNNSNALKEQLEAIMFEFQEAEINYTKASSLANADYCSWRAQLIALQLYHFNKSKFTALHTDISTTVPILINLDMNRVRDFINQCNHYYEALIVAKSYPDVNIEWADPFFNNAIVNNNVQYAAQFLDNYEISVSFLEKKIFLILEQIMESILCDGVNTTAQTNDSNVESSTMKFASTSFLKINLHDRYRLARRLNSRRILRHLMALNRENSAYLLDWIAKSNQNQCVNNKN
ncbi:spatacsin-like protein [Dermatophagoides farinae]|uniref:Spatacsin-like protein n=1 Tax=Dermatophagoides farinae TaxID=6954 RepID=A0A9D4NVJ0_DERFA|nr:spatacsin-like protein [Dermatophagoides farinae]